MKLHWSPRSPFVRKVMIVLHETGLADLPEYVRSPVRMTAAPNPDVIRDNPLGKIPALVLDDGSVMFDSRVIAAYLSGIAPDRALVPGDFDARIRDLRWEALGDGLTETLLIWRTEELRGDRKHQMICDSFSAKVHASMAQLEREAPALTDTPFGIGHASIVCSLGQLDFRFAGCGWRDAFPALAAWHLQMQDRPSVEATAIKDDNALDMGDVDMPLKF